MKLQLWFVFLALLAGEAYSMTCNGTVLLTDPFGVIEDGSGIGENYAREVLCTWTIVPSNNVNQIEFEILLLDTELGFDFLTIYAGSLIAGNIVASLSGQNIASRRFIVNAPTATVRFNSDQLITGDGFSLRYAGNNCDCAGRGSCFNGICACDEGWSPATNCSTPICASVGTDECNSPMGTCQNSTEFPGFEQCQCETGYFGGSCEENYCLGRKIETALSNDISDHSAPGSALPFSNCEWLIQPSQPVDTIQFQFTQFDLATDARIRVFDGNSTTSRQIGAFTRSNSLPPPVYAFSGSMLVTFATLASARTGFVGHYESFLCNPECVNGHCVNDGTLCQCEIGYGGPACNETACTNNCFESAGAGSCDTNTTMCVCNPGYGGLDCGLCVNQTCASAQCSGSVMLNTPTGTLADHVGPGDYLPNSTCLWTIAPPNPSSWTSIVLTFQSFDLEFGSAFVTIVDELGHEIATYTGNQLPPPVFVSTGAVTISFTSFDSQLVGGGFSLSWDTSSCLNQCSELGICFNGTCQCDVGFTGPDCSQTECVNDCSGNGFCSGDHCVCELGYYGPDCLSQVCQGVSVLSDIASGVLSSGFLSTQYRPNMNCQWLIEMPGATTWYFNEFQTEPLTDIVRVYNGPTTSSPLVLEASGHFPPLPFLTLSTQVLVTWTSNANIEFQGFSAAWTWQDQCPQSCSNAGFCENSECNCQGGRTGNDCSETLAPTVLTPAISATGFVPPRRWEYFAFDVVESMPELLFENAIVGNGGNPIFYLRFGDFPTNTDFDQVAAFFSQPPSFSVRSPQIGRYYLGVYSNTLGENSGFNITAMFTCDNLCSNGACQPESGTCECIDGFTGTLCNIPESSSEGVNDSVIAVAVVFSVVGCILFVVIIILIAAIVYTARKAQTGRIVVVKQSEPPKDREETKKKKKATKGQHVELDEVSVPSSANASSSSSSSSLTSDTSNEE